MSSNVNYPENIDDDIEYMMEYYAEYHVDNMEMQMMEYGVSWSDFI